MSIEPISNAAASAEAAKSAAATAGAVGRSAQLISVTAPGQAGMEMVTGFVLDLKQPTATDPGQVTIYDVQNMRIVIKSPPPSKLGMA